MRRFLLCACAVGGLGAVSGAASLNLSYSLAPSGGLWVYDLTLSVDTSSSGWSAGMGWTWVTFGDVPNNGTSPLSDFAVTSGFPVGPWGSLSFSYGGHNRPTFLFDSANSITYWVPTSASDTVTWSGTSAFHATPGSLQFSELLTQGGATRDEFKDMLEVVPEPASMLILGGLIPMVLRKRRARK